MHEIQTFFQAQGLARALDGHPRVAALPDDLLMELWAAGKLGELMDRGRERVCAMALDDTFVEAGCGRALEPHPRLAVLPIPTLWGLVQRQQAEAVIEWGTERHREIELEESDPFNYGWRGDPGKSREMGGSWKRVQDAIATVRKECPKSIPKILCMGGNGSSKSEFGAWYAMKLMVENPKFAVAVLCPSEKQARKVMMKRFWKYIPLEWKPSETGKSKQGVVGNISYSEKMGFTENIFILPNGSSCTFFFYEDGDPKSIEGDELDLVVADEEVPLNWLEAAEFRLVRRRGIILALFTPISGYTPTVAYFKGELSKVIEDREAELLPIYAGVTEGSAGGPEAFNQQDVVGYKRLPMVELGADRTKRIIYFWTQDCPYPATNYETLKDQLKTMRASPSKIEERAYGIPKKVRDAAFPLFSTEVHCLSLAEACEAIHGPDDVTFWMVADPANGRNPFMQWWGCDRLGRSICFREWPQQDDYIPRVGMPGAWATLSKKAKKLDGDKGDAQESWGLGYPQLAEEIKRVEEWLAVHVCKLPPGSRAKIFKRILDSRLGNTTMHGTTIQKEFAKEKVNFTLAQGKNLNITTADNESQAGITLINNALYYDCEKPLGPQNRPKLYVVYEPPQHEGSTPVGCANTAFALKTWTGADKETGACKDPVDTTHYFLREEPRFVTFRYGERSAQAWGGYGS